MAEYRWRLAERVVSDRVIGIIRAPDADTAAELGTRLIGAGLHSVEVSLSTPAALSAIRRLAGGAALVGAGTVLDAQQAGAAIEAGARFLVCPTLSTDVIRSAHRHGVPVVAGAATPTEVLTALEHGADLVKIFPASQSSPGSLRDLLQALPYAPLVPTGGVSAATAPEWIAAGAAAVGIGGELTRGPAAETPGRVAALLSALRTSA
ncbi:2-dehydro-3-deoxyphosphogluconate aldolase/(4S)-4-hydroxy-2-oxoglutarate aldolase [Streptosporangium becharense]|uniref:2-dehydro-3-deoxyphosphogluconate aldolase/(4S)-4-hydroxy-2-oxoglutarate aldolase n=1 Tax=Streptosporangium becharense TaxID=1816182 RepID=A0A7W9IMD4_9ACTN|nr:bifunctional 4-hydroxy-2-oxoglutarate aldolase/2-dehydro-3-deoxy-phosphogluconate aldolase [Streptosporangium becharense]MBB2915140.1 2-dehydro-3-deoxyphosphogluconate aldolase/(4S)-4-hydroxy-2-oxoglutarate aldolase [Streptosporangium becharense]MBB5822788.1 2-dehydro-3-deoxyphosphogluconate aldolase/(4S)-4-hydroxy-2-oxoglutarate aldolase [Streptosporangium becharense]